MRRPILSCALLTMAQSVLAQSPGPLATQATTEGAASEHSSDAIARKLADPGAALVSVPIQYNYLGDVGTEGDHNQQLKIQPVIPFVGEQGKFLLRPIFPLQWNHYPERKHGVGDLFVQGYYIPTHGRSEAATEFGYGAAVLLDTASDDTLGAGKDSLGPAFLFVHKTRKWTIGVLANQVWSIAGDRSRPDVSQTSVQPFLTRHLPNGWSAGFTSESSFNWKASSGDEWTVPVGGSVSKVVKIGDVPVSFGLGGFYNIERPEHANRWTARLTITLVFPDGRSARQ